VQYGERWLAQRTDLRPRTQELYEGLWRLWLEPAFSTETLGSMTPETWRAWFVKATSDHPGSTQPAKAYRLARAMLNTAVDDGLLKSNPCRVKGAGREDSPERPVVMPDVVGRIAENMTDRYRLMVLLGAYCSLRFGELAGLRRHRIDLLHRTITVEEQAVELANGSTIFGPPKSAAGRRVVAFPVELVPMIEDHLAEYVPAAPDALLFTSREGLPLRRTKFRPHWADACKRAQVTGLHFHDLRGSGATWAATAGATVRELMSRLGHSTPAVALRYQHATLERDKAIADRLGLLLADESPAAIPTVG
jgi:integrase